MDSIINFVVAMTVCVGLHKTIDYAANAIANKLVSNDIKYDSDDDENSTEINGHLPDCLSLLNWPLRDIY
jgi:hypothetical protein